MKKHISISDLKLFLNNRSDDMLIYVSCDGCFGSVNSLSIENIYGKDVIMIAESPPALYPPSELGPVA